MEEKKKNTSPILIVCLILLCVAMLLVGWWLGNKFYDKENPTIPEEKAASFTCDGEVFDASKDSVESLINGEGWSGAGAGIEYTLVSNKLTYTTWIETCYKDDEACDETQKITSKVMETGYNCEYLFDAGGTGICYLDGKFYRIDFNTGVFDKNDVYSIKPVIEDITSSCKKNQ